MGTRPPVMLVHGMWSTSETLAELAQAFSEEGYAVNVPNLPFHLPKTAMDRGSRDGMRRSGIPEYVDAVTRCLDELDQPPILVGHSMGGLIAQLVASRRQCAALVLISSASPAGVNAWSYSAVRTLGHNLLKFPLWRKLTEMQLENIRYGIANTQTDAVQHDILKQMTFESGKALWQISMWFVSRKPVTRVNTDAIECPVLILGGSQDRITPISKQRKIARLYPGRARLIEIPEACHWTVGGSHLPAVKGHIHQWLNYSVQLSPIG